MKIDEVPGTLALAKATKTTNAEIAFRIDFSGLA
jgi:hypothetical protein